LTHKCKIYPQGVIDNQYKYKEMQRIGDVLHRKAQQEAEKQKVEEEKR
jgi:hypothetical protein